MPREENGRRWQIGAPPNGESTRRINVDNPCAIQGPERIDFEIGDPGFLQFQNLLPFPQFSLMLWPKSEKEMSGRTLCYLPLFSERNVSTIRRIRPAVSRARSTRRSVKCPQFV